MNGKNFQPRRGNLGNKPHPCNNPRDHNPAAARNGGERPPQSRIVAATENFRVPWVQLKYFTFNPNVYPRFVGATSGNIAAGDTVSVYDKDGNAFGHGFYNAGANIPLRIFSHDKEPLPPDFFEKTIRRAIALRTEMLHLPATTDAFRVVHGDADGLNGLVVDKYGDVLSVEVFSFAVYRRIKSWLPIFHDALGTTRETIQLVKGFGSMENVRGCDDFHTAGLREVKIRENGVRFVVDFENGHKTGFFCDQRDNRKRLAQFCAGARVLDLCCYTGGFSLAAKVLGGAADVVGVDLDETAVAQAKRNANLNQARVNFVHSDAFTYARQMQANGELFDVVVLDPPKLIDGRDDYESGFAKYHDLNKVALPLVKKGGLFVTNSCSGLLKAEDFESLVIRVAHRLGCRLQILDRTGPGLDHPVISNYPEGRYLKTLWAIVL
ncbi:MAG: class I SAM-dependent rRNA methyltransferase [Opitutae bacterium]|nr:class I SAM-dependent rRNA methyltransferase [Opitutae bacterium]